MIVMTALMRETIRKIITMKAMEMGKITTMNTIDK